MRCRRPSAPPTGDRETGDNATTSDVLSFLKEWQRLFPQLRGNPFWLAGESYAGRWRVEPLPGSRARSLQATDKCPAMQPGNPGLSPPVPSLRLVSSSLATQSLAPPTCVALHAGHYVPNLAFKLLQHNRPAEADAGVDDVASRALRVNFRGFLLGALRTPCALTCCQPTGRAACRCSLASLFVAPCYPSSTMQVLLAS